MTKYHTDERNETIEDWAQAHPKCFFPDPQQRRPLAHSIVDDLEKAGAPDRERVAQVVQWYCSHWGYQYQLVAGNERIGLDGKRAGTVTPAEEREARTRVAKEKAEQREKQKVALLAASVPVAAKQQLNGAHVIKATPTSHPLLPQLADMTSAIGVIRTVLTENQFEALRPALAATALREIIARAEKLIGEINPT